MCRTDLVALLEKARIERKEIARQARLSVRFNFPEARSRKGTESVLGLAEIERPQRFCLNCKTPSSAQADNLSACRGCRKVRTLFCVITLDQKSHLFSTCLWIFFSKFLGILLRGELPEGGLGGAQELLQEADEDEEEEKGNGNKRRWQKLWRWRKKRRTLMNWTRQNTSYQSICLDLTLNWCVNW